MCLDIQLNADQSASDGLNIRLELKSGKLVNLVQDCLSHLRMVYDLSNLLGIHVVKMMPLELSLLLNLTGNII